MINLTDEGVVLDAGMLKSYLRYLIDRIFKILPLREEGSETLDTYISSLQSEMIGCSSLYPPLGDDPNFLSLIATLQYFKEHPEEPVSFFKREVFRCISTCNHLRAKYLKAVE